MKNSLHRAQIDVKESRRGSGTMNNIFNHIFLQFFVRPTWYEVPIISVIVLPLYLSTVVESPRDLMSNMPGCYHEGFSAHNVVFSAPATTNFRKALPT